MTSHPRSRKILGATAPAVPLPLSTTTRRFLLEMDIFQEIVLVFGGDRAERNGPPAVGKIVRLDDPAEFLDLLPVERVFPHANFKPVELGGIVAAGDHDSPLPFQVVKGKIEDRGRADPDIDHFQPSHFHAPDQGVPEP